MITIFQQKENLLEIIGVFPDCSIMIISTDEKKLESNVPPAEAK